MAPGAIFPRPHPVTPGEAQSEHGPPEGEEQQPRHGLPATEPALSRQPERPERRAHDPPPGGQDTELDDLLQPPSDHLHDTPTHGPHPPLLSHLSHPPLLSHLHLFHLSPPPLLSPSPLTGPPHTRPSSHTFTSHARPFSPIFSLLRILPSTRSHTQQARQAHGGQAFLVGRWAAQLQAMWQQEPRHESSHPGKPTWRPHKEQLNAPEMRTPRLPGCGGYCEGLVGWGGSLDPCPPPESCCRATGPISRAISPEATSRTYGLQSRDTKCTNARTIGPEGASEATGQTFHSRC